MRVLSLFFIFDCLERRFPSLFSPRFLNNEQLEPGTAAAARATSQPSNRSLFVSYQETGQECCHPTEPGELRLSSLLNKYYDTEPSIRMVKVVGMN